MKVVINKCQKTTLDYFQSSIFKKMQNGNAILHLMTLICMLETHAYKWETPDVLITLVSESDVQHPSLLTHASLRQAITEFNAIPHIYPALHVVPHRETINKQLLARRSDNTQDGYNTIRFASSGYPAYTNLHLDYKTVPYTLREFDMVLDPKWIQTPEMLHLLLLHELGHVMGLQHPPQPTDTVMGYVVQLNEFNMPVQEQDVLHLTRQDVKDIYLHSFVHYTSLQSLVLQQLHQLAGNGAIPHTLSEQRWAYKKKKECFNN
jgi:hypothetical protein